MVTFLGQFMSQDWNDFPIWEEFFNKYPIKTFIELGTGVGGMSTFLALQCYQRGIKFHTFDNQRFMKWDVGVPALLKLRDCFHFQDMWCEENVKDVTSIFTKEPHPLAIFFDDGDKPREWRTFAHLALVGDFLIVHDWGTEFLERDIIDVPVEPIMVEMCDSRPTWSLVSRWFKRI